MFRSRSFDNAMKDNSANTGEAKPLQAERADMASTLPVAVDSGSTEPLSTASESDSSLAAALEPLSVGAYLDSSTRAALNGLIDAVVVCDKLGHVVYFNKAARTMFGYEDDEIFQRDVSILMPEPYRSRHAGYVSKYLLVRPTSGRALFASFPSFGLFCAF